MVIWTDLLQYLKDLKNTDRQQISKIPTIQQYPIGSNLSPSFIGELPDKKHTIDRLDAISSMGSCFAREIKDYLIRNKFNYVQREKLNPRSIHGSCAWERVYTSANAYQISKYSADLNAYALEERVFQNKENQFIDLLRTKTSYSNYDKIKSEIIYHSKESRETLLNSSFFIFTLGQNEVWYDSEKDIYLAQKPTERYSQKFNVVLKQLSVSENIFFLKLFYRNIKSINPKLKFIISLSPVPSNVTFFKENVVTQSFLNKAILRVSIQELLKDPEFSDIEYFPSFEIVYHSKGNPFRFDNRHIKKSTVNRIMKTFSEKYLTN